MKPTKKGTAKKKSDDDDDDDDDDIDDEDDWEAGEDGEEEDEEWDPDFDEFDLPKSTKKAGKKPASDEEEEFKIDDEFKDLGFDDLDGGFDDEDDF